MCTRGLLFPVLIFHRRRSSSNINVLMSTYRHSVHVEMVAYKSPAMSASVAIRF